MDIKCKQAQRGLLARISTVAVKYAIKPNNGKIYWHIAEADFAKSSIDKYRTILAFQKGFEILAPAFHPIKFESTADKKLAPIELFFKRNGEKGLPEKFDEGVLAYAFFPGSDLQGIESNVYFNDALPWEEMHMPGKYSLLKVFVHECLHALGLDHSSIKADIMFPTYQPNNDITLTGDTLQGLDKLYGKYKSQVALEVAPTIDIPASNIQPTIECSILDWLKKFFRRRYQVKALSSEQVEVLCKELGIHVPAAYAPEDLKTQICNKLGI